MQRPTKLDTCNVCKATFAEDGTVPIPDDPELYWTSVRCTFQCRACGHLSPLDHLDMDGSVECLRCGLDQAFDVGSWREGLEHARTLGLASARAATSQYSAIGETHTAAEHQQGGLVIGGGQLTQLSLRVNAAPGTPLCPECRAPFVASFDATGAMTVRCHACSTSMTTKLPAPGKSMCPELRGVLAEAQVEGRREARVKGGEALAVLCPTCDAPLAVTGASINVTCTYCRTPSRIPRKRMFELGHAAPTPTVWWLAFDRRAVEAKAKAKAEAKARAKAKADNERAERRRKKQEARERAASGEKRSRGRSPDPSKKKPEQSFSLRKGFGIALVIAIAIAGIVAFSIWNSKKPGGIQLALWLDDDRIVAVHEPRLLPWEDPRVEVLVVRAADGAVMERAQHTSKKKELRGYGPYAGHLWVGDASGLVAYPTSGATPLRRVVDMRPALAAHPELSAGFEISEGRLLFAGSAQRGLPLRGKAGGTYMITPAGISKVDLIVTGQPERSLYLISLGGESSAKGPDGKTSLSVEHLVLRNKRIPLDADGKVYWSPDASGVVVLGRTIKNAERGGEEIVLMSAKGDAVWSVNAVDAFGPMTATLSSSRPTDARVAALRIAKGVVLAAVRGASISEDDDGISVTYDFKMLALDAKTGQVRRSVSIQHPKE
ncbi:MAG: hypothetical protein KIT84_06370 [Labilithrix sp.]|nr:hypothetical protein [Labilithrix sp.]MCW5810617.1 hypothetical protein [Labilithrix sp.]